MKALSPYSGRVDFATCEHIIQRLNDFSLVLNMMVSSKWVRLSYRTKFRASNGRWALLTIHIIVCSLGNVLWNCRLDTIKPRLIPEGKVHASDTIRALGQYCSGAREQIYFLHFIRSTGICMISHIWNKNNFILWKFSGGSQYGLLVSGGAAAAAWWLGQPWATESRTTYDQIKWI